jgi:NDP-4-keto-2,6-dideoxyhexose 3-C-methyltransferase
MVIEPQEIRRCRMCGSDSLETVIDLGDQCLTGIFPRAGAGQPRSAPLRLLRCLGECGLVQLAHSGDLEEMYGANYGYRSGLNPSMVQHLQDKVRRIQDHQALTPGDAIIDIGSNDGTTLNCYPQGIYELIGIDPTGDKFRGYYSPGVKLLPEFFSAKRASQVLEGRKAQVVTSFSMFYDLEDPLAFMREVRAVLADDGMWVFEQSYLPAMLETNSFDTICHEHLEYYGIRQLAWAAERSGLELSEVEFNPVNGGSCSVTARPAGGTPVHGPTVLAALADERRLGLHTPEPYRAFTARVAGCRAGLLEFITAANQRGERVAGLGASTKGNVLLQYLGIDEKLLPVIGEVNPDKFGCVTPGTRIPILPEREVLAGPYAYLLVLPWHFRQFLVGRPHLRGRRLLMPLPTLEVVVGGS